MVEDDKGLDRATTADLAEAGDSTGSLAGITSHGDDRREDEKAPLLPENEADELRKGWDSIQVSFVDEPRRAVEQADELIARAMKRLAEMFAEERSDLERQWDSGDSVSTEDLRIALQRYRAFFGRLLSV
jgi:hypothetical protein